MIGETRRLGARAYAPISMALAAITLLALPMLASPQSYMATERERATQQSTAAPPSNDFLTNNSRATIQALEQHLFSPEVQNRIERIFQSRVEYEGKVHTFQSFKYTFRGFWRNWKRMMKDGVPTGSSSVGSGGGGGGGGEGKFVLFAGDEEERRVDVVRDPRNPRDAKRPVAIFGYEYGLANMAAFLSQAMVDGIHDDACDESNEQAMLDRSGRPTRVFPFSNACGQWNSTYADMTCPPSEKDMECPPVPPEKTITASFATGKNGLKCGPTNLYPSIRNHKNDKGRTDAEGCCWWGRGPLHTKGLCNMGKVNYYLGVKAFNEGRITLSTPGVFPDIDFCDTPEAVCQTNATNEDLMWSVAMFEWAERIQQYRSADGSWDYKEKLVEFVNGGMNMFEYYTDEIITDRDNAFIHAVSSIVDRGCHNAPGCVHSGGPVNKLPLRRVAFTVALGVLNIPTMRSELVVEQALDHMKSKQDRIEKNLLLYKTEEGIFPSQRYKFDDFFDALHRFSRPYAATDISYTTNITYFHSTDHAPFYMGKPYMKHGHKYGLANIALFLSNGLQLSIEQDETCDELNQHQVSGKLPLSNSCGQKGISYQDMRCSDDPDLACPVDVNMYITAVTADRAFGAPPPLQCGPKYRIPSTGYWDFEMMQESDLEVYANLNARVDVEGCCWWARGVLQTKGTCSFGRLNYYLGKRAANEGRESLFPDIDFCSNPEAVCGSASSKHELLWMSGLFEWIDRIQSYDQGGFNYMEQLHAFADGEMRNDVFIKNVAAIVQTGCHSPPCKNAGCLDFPCDGAYPVDEDASARKAFRTFFELNLWDLFPTSPGGSNAPSPAPTQSPLCQTDCTDFPSMSPLTPTSLPSEAPIVPISSVPSESPTRVVDARITHFEDVSMHLKRRRGLIESEIFVSELYTLDGFLNSLQELATAGADDILFYVGQGNVDDFNHGLVNIALFLAHAMTRGILWDTCEEVNQHIVDGKLPLSNACGQHGRSYSDDICPQTDAAMECAVDPYLNVRQASVGNSGSPPFFCASTSLYPFTGYYDPLSGSTVSSKPFANQAGRTDVAGCCFWGRGILLNQGVCDIGRFNHIYGLPAFIDGRSSGRYNIDFCSHPQALCSDFTIPATGFNKIPTTVDTSEVRYLISLLYWADYVQDYDWGPWQYMEKLKLFVDGGMKDHSFVDEFSEIVIDSKRDGDPRKANFEKVLNILFTEAPTQSPTPKPTESPSMKPSFEPTYAPNTFSAERPGGAFGPPGQNAVGEPGGEDATAGPISPNQQPASNPNRPVAIDISAPSLPSNTIVDIGRISSATYFYSSSLVWVLLQCIFGYYIMNKFS